MKKSVLKRYTPDCSIHMSAEIAFMRENPTGSYVEFNDYFVLETLLLARDADEARDKVKRQELARRNQELSYALCNRMPLSFWWRFLFRTFILGGRDD